MTWYQFEDSLGNGVDLEYDFGKAPDVGAIVEHEGQKLRRVFSLPVVAVERDGRCEMVQVPPWTPGAKEYGPNGEPRCATRREQSAVADNAGMVAR